MTGGNIGEREKGHFYEGWGRKVRKSKLKYVYLGPTVITLLIIGIIPFIYCLYMSFFRWNLADVRGVSFVGLANYVSVVTSRVFLRSMKVTFYFAGGVLGGELGLGMVLAMLLAQEFPGRGVYRSLFLLPVVATPVVVGLCWVILYNADFGMINYFLSHLGLPQPAWLGDYKWALPSLIVTDWWEWTPFVALILLAGLQALPTEPFEAAKVDGASPYQIFIHVTLPLLRPAILVAVLFRMIDAFRWFDTIYVMTRGGPGEATLSLHLFAYLEGFRYLKFGHSSAIATILLLITLIPSFFLVKKLSQKVEQ